MTVENSIMSGCGLSHECAEYGLKGQLGEVLSDQHKGTRNVVGLRDPISLK